MKFRSVFIAVFISSSLVVAAFILNSRRPAIETNQPTAAHVRATGKCAACHRNETSAIVHQFERSAHAAKGVTCFDCHRSLDKQASVSHHGFTLAKQLTSLNCKSCHTAEYEQFEKSRHALPAWAAVKGPHGASDAMVAHAEKYHPGMVKRPANKLAQIEGQAAIGAGCLGCHDIGKPNGDGSVGSCTQCHSRHDASVALAREPTTCGQCHMGPDHSQLEIYNESKHGALYRTERTSMNLRADPKKLTTADMRIPTCATCHMSGLEGQKVTHDTTERLSLLLYAAATERRPAFQRGRDQMQETCRNCHAKSIVEKIYDEGDAVVAATNTKVMAAKKLIDDLRKEGLLTPAPFDEKIEFVYFDLWHYYGRTAKHGAFMGGADFVQWHGNYELLQLMVELREMAAELRHKRDDNSAAKQGADPS